MRPPYFKSGSSGSTTVIVTTQGPSLYEKRLLELAGDEGAGLLVIRLRDFFDIVRTAMLGKSQIGSARLREAVAQLDHATIKHVVLVQSYLGASMRVLAVIYYALRRWGRRISVEWPAQDAEHGAHNRLNGLTSHEYIVLTMWGVLPWPLVYDVEPTSK